MSRVVIEVDGNYCDWGQLLDLLHAAFEYQKNRINPPSSLYTFDVISIAAKAKRENLIVAKNGNRLLGCVFVRVATGKTYLSKFAVLPSVQQQGLGRQMLEAAEKLVLRKGQSLIELDTRIELLVNHKTFAKFGFVKISEHSHQGFHQPTYIKMQKKLDNKASS